MLLQLLTPPSHDRKPSFMAQALAAIHHGNPRRWPLRLILASHGKAVGTFIDCDSRLSSLVTGQIADRYPDCRLARVNEDVLADKVGLVTLAASVRLTPDFFPLPEQRAFEDIIKRKELDPLSGLLTALRPIGPIRYMRLEITLRPATRFRCRLAERMVRRLSGPFFLAHPFLALIVARAASSRWWALRQFARLVAMIPRPTQTARVDQEFQALVRNAHAKCEGTLFAAHLRIQVAAKPEHRSEAEAKLEEIAGTFGQFNPSRLIAFQSRRIRGRWPKERGSLLSPQEVALLWHPPTELLRVERFPALRSRELEAPTEFSAKGKDAVVLGRVKYRSRHDLVTIGRDDRLRHLAIIGKTGMGKSTLLLNMLAADIKAGRGCCLIDPHGDLADTLHGLIPKHRTNDVVWFDAGDRNKPASFNPLHCPDEHSRPLVASGIVSAFKKMFGNSWGPRMEHILRNALLTLLEQPDSTLMTLGRAILTGAIWAGWVDCGCLGTPMVRMTSHEHAKS